MEIAGSLIVIYMLLVAVKFERHDPIIKTLAAIGYTTANLFLSDMYTNILSTICTHSRRVYI